MTTMPATAILLTALIMTAVGSVMYMYAHINDLVYTTRAAAAEMVLFDLVKTFHDCAIYSIYTGKECTLALAYNNLVVVNVDTQRDVLEVDTMGAKANMTLDFVYEMVKKAVIRELSVTSDMVEVNFSCQGSTVPQSIKVASSLLHISVNVSASTTGGGSTYIVSLCVR